VRRRTFLTAVAGAAAWTLPVSAQRPRMPRIGVLLPLAENDPEQVDRREGLRQALEKLAWIDGRTAQIEYRHAGGGLGRFAPLAKEMVALNPDVIYVNSTGFVAAVQRETRTIPTVFTNVSDPIGAGFVASLPRPGGNLTGLQLFEASVAGKWLSMLKEIAPHIKSAALTGNPKTTAFDYFLRTAEAAAPSLGIEVIANRIETTADIEGSMAMLAQKADRGLLFAPDSTIIRNRDLIIRLAAHHRLPAVYPERLYATAGGLMSYGVADLIEPFRQAATYIDRILRGEKPAELPVQGPTKYSTVINLKTAKALGLTVPSGLLVAADEVIE
jgi:putative ABC transport system substrate-binding protein